MTFFVFNLCKFDHHQRETYNFKFRVVRMRRKDFRKKKNRDHILNLGIVLKLLKVLNAISFENNSTTKYLIRNKNWKCEI